MHRADKLVQEVELDGTYLLKQAATYTAVLVGVPYAIDKVAERVLRKRPWPRTGSLFKVTDWG